MTTDPAQPPPAPAPPVQPVHCGICGYQLNGLRIDEPCPECGTIIHRALLAQHSSSGAAVGALVCGIVSIPASFFYGVPGVIVALIALPLARKAKRDVANGRAAPSAMSLITAGRICAWVGMGIGLAFTALIAGVIFLSMMV